MINVSTEDGNKIGQMIFQAKPLPEGVTFVALKKVRMSIISLIANVLALVVFGIVMLPDLARVFYNEDVTIDSFLSSGSFIIWAFMMVFILVHVVRGLKGKAPRQAGKYRYGLFLVGEMLLVFSGGIPKVAMRSQIYEVAMASGKAGEALLQIRYQSDKGKDKVLKLRNDFDQPLETVESKVREWYSVGA